MLQSIVPAAVCTVYLGLGTIAMAVGFLVGRGFGAGFALRPFSKRANRQYRKILQVLSYRAQEVRAQDTRPPVLLLRSFVDEDMALQRRLGMFIQVLSISRTLEEVVVDRIWSVGPVIAVGRPVAELSPLGAAREYIVGPDWQSRVDTLVNECSLVVSVLGETEGLLWEYRRLAARHTPLLLVVPHGDAPVLLHRWRSFCGAYPAAASIPVPEGKGSDFPLLVWFQPGHEALVLTCKCQNELSYELAFDDLLFCRGLSNTTAEAAGSQRAERGRMAREKAEQGRQQQEEAESASVAALAEAERKRAAEQARPEQKRQPVAEPAQFVSGHTYDVGEDPSHARPWLASNWKWALPIGLIAVFLVVMLFNVALRSSGRAASGRSASSQKQVQPQGSPVKEGASNPATSPESAPNQKQVQPQDSPAKAKTSNPAPPSAAAARPAPKKDLGTQSPQELGPSVFNGTWRDRKDRLSTITLQISGDLLLMINSRGEDYIVKLDGTRGAYHGNPNCTGTSHKLMNKNTLLGTFFYNDEVIEVHTVTISADGKTMYVSGEDKRTNRTYKDVLDKVEDLPPARDLRG